MSEEENVESITKVFERLGIDDPKKEYWFEIEYDNEDTPYEFSNHGRIRKGEKIMKQFNENGYF